MKHSEEKGVNLFLHWFEKIALRDLSQEHKVEMLRILKSGKPKEVEKMIPVFEKVVNESKLEGERNKGLEIARDMLVEGCDVDFVAKITKLALDEVRGLKSEMENKVGI